MNSRIKTWTNSFIRIYPKLTTIEHNKTYFVGKSLNPPQQGTSGQQMVKSQISTGLLLIILATLTAAAPPLAQENIFIPSN